MTDNFKIIAQKLNGKINRSWNCELVKKSDSLLEFVGIFDISIDHQVLGHIARGTYSHEYYWTDRWYNVFRFHQPDHKFMFYYCNINLPPVVEENILTYTDLDIDIIIRPGKDPEVLDMDEFDENKKRFNYPRSTISNALKALDDVVISAKNNDFPFLTHILS